MKITITQTGTNEDGFTAKIQFDGGADYPVTIHDPFSVEEEERLGWYFEQWLTFPFTGHVKAHLPAHKRPSSRALSPYPNTRPPEGETTRGNGVGESPTIPRVSGRDDAGNGVGESLTIPRVVSPLQHIYDLHGGIIREPI
jgi:hypothetical protein